MSPMRCTQNPATGEEWRRGWHPETIAPFEQDGTFLVVGGGPAGLEAACALGKRGAEVILAEAGDFWGGRVTLESRLPGLAAWARVRDWRLWHLRQMPNVEMYLESPLSATDILDYGIRHVALATGAKWRADGTGRSHRTPLSFLANGSVLTPDDLLTVGAGHINPDDTVVVFDDDRFYMASVLAELLANGGFRTVFVTPAPVVAPWTVNTLEQARIQSRLMKLGVSIHPLKKLVGRTPDTLTIACVYSGEQTEIECATLVPVTARLPDDRLWRELAAREELWSDAGIHEVTRIGDCLSPGLIATAVSAGHAFAQSAGSTTNSGPAREDVAGLSGPVGA